jgi:hypothetical protein
MNLQVACFSVSFLHKVTMHIALRLVCSDFLNSDSVLVAWRGLLAQRRTSIYFVKANVFLLLGEKNVENA